MKTELVTRYVRADMTAHNGFTWPKSGPVSCPDWDPVPKCGNGLHGWLHGKGEAGAWGNRHVDDLMLVVEVDAAMIVDLGGKVKFPGGVVVYCGDAAGMSAFMAAAGYTGGLIHGTSTSGDYGTSTSGAYGTSTSGAYGTSTSGAYGTSTSGVSGTSTSGAYGTSTSGARGTSTSGASGTSTSGVSGTSTSGASGTSTSGAYGIVVVRWYDVKANRSRLAIGYVGEDGIKANTPYKCDDNGKLYEVTP